MTNIKLKKDLQNYIDLYFVDEEKIKKAFEKKPKSSFFSRFKKKETMAKCSKSMSFESACLSVDESFSEKECAKKSSIDDFINIVKDKQTFSEYLFALIDESGETDADVYNRAGIDRRLFSKIRSNSDYQPSKNTIFALAMSLKLDHTKTSKLLNKAGYEFSNNKLTDIIIMFCIENKIYDLYQIDAFLVEYKQKPIASAV